jgi:hypothetical protein
MGRDEMTRNETIRRLGAGLRHDTTDTVQAALPACILDLLTKLDQAELQRKLAGSGEERATRR